MATHLRQTLAAASAFCGILSVVIITIVATIPPTYASPYSIAPIQRSTIELPISGNLIERGQLYYNPSHQQPNWDAPEAFLEQLEPTQSIGIKGGDFWLNLSVKNATEVERWSIKVDGSFIEHIETFIFTHIIHHSHSELIGTSKDVQSDGGGYIPHYGMDISLAPKAT